MAYYVRTLKLLEARKCLEKYVRICEISEQDVMFKQQPDQVSDPCNVC